MDELVLHVGDGTVFELSPVDGFQVYIIPPVAFKFTADPAHKVTVAGEALIFGTEFMFTITVVVPGQPPLFPVTV